MITNKPIQGFDVSTAIGGASGPELVGEFQEIEFSIKSDMESYLEQNERIAKILDGEIKIEGKLKRGFINMGVLKSCFGTDKIETGTKLPSMPRFTITFSINAPDKGIVGKYKLTHVVIPELTIGIGKGKEISKADYTFKAEGIQEA